MSANFIRVECHACTSKRTMPQPTYPVKIQHSCDMAEPGRAFWAMVPEGVEPPTGALR